MKYLSERRMYALSVVNLQIGHVRLRHVRRDGRNAAGSAGCKSKNEKNRVRQKYTRVLSIFVLINTARKREN